MNFIDDTIKITFPLSRALKNAIDECEKADQSDNYGIYINAADYLTDTVAKEAFRKGDITKAQWEALERRYIQ